MRKSEVSVKRPKVIEEHYEGFSAIDVHDHSRQGTLAGEKRWQTETWWHRLYCTVWGVILYDAYLAYAMIYKQRYHTYEGCLNFITFLGRLAYQMIFPETQNPSTMEQQENQDDDNDEEEHQLATTRYASEILNEKKLEDEWRVSCDECGTRTSFFCMGCSDIQNRNLVGLCSKERNPKSRCWNNHKRKP